LQHIREIKKKEKFEIYSNRVCVCEREDRVRREAETGDEIGENCGKWGRIGICVFFFCIHPMTIRVLSIWNTRASNITRKEREITNLQNNFENNWRWWWHKNKRLIRVQIGLNEMKKKIKRLIIFLKKGNL
jgi:hypothetical protein